MANLRKIAEKARITLCEKLHCEFVIAVSSSSILNRIANRTYKARADWPNHFYSPWESRGYKVENQNGQLRLI